MARLRFIVEILNQFLKLARRQAVKRIEGNTGTAWLSDRDNLIVIVATAKRQRASGDQQPTGTENSPQSAGDAATPIPPHRQPHWPDICLWFSSARAKRSGKGACESSPS